MTRTATQEEELKRLIKDQERRLLNGTTMDTRLIRALREALADLAARGPVTAPSEPAWSSGAVAMRHVLEAAVRYVGQLQSGASKARREAVERPGFGGEHAQEDEYQEGRHDMATEILNYLSGMLEEAGR
jgi:hypothetical protein